MDSHRRWNPHPVPSSADGAPIKRRILTPYPVNDHGALERLNELSAAWHEASRANRNLAFHQNERNKVEEQLYRDYQAWEARRIYYQREYDESMARGPTISDDDFLSKSERSDRTKYVNQKLEQDPEAVRASEGIQEGGRDLAHRQDSLVQSRNALDSASQEVCEWLHRNFGLSPRDIRCITEHHFIIPPRQAHYANTLASAAIH